MQPAELIPKRVPPAEDASAGTADTSALGDSAAVTGAQASLDAGDQVGVIWEKMRAGWMAGKPVPAEQFLTPDFLAICGTEGAVDIIYGEFALAEAHGRRPQPSDYLRRFPQFAVGLEKQLAIHSAIELDASDATYLRAAPNEWGDELRCPGPFGRYLLVAPLDTGGQSQVYRAVHPDLGKEVVLKIAKRSDNPREPQQDDRLAAEAKLLASLSHPNLAPIYDAGVVDGRAYLAMEYVRGRTLAQHAKHARPTPQQAALIVAKTARALATVHAAGVLHLDIKPKNIVIDEQGEPRLIDFGLSRLDHAWSRPPEDEGLAGTLEFMAPEQARCETDRLSPATDLFSLGGVLYYLLTGQAVFAGKSTKELLKVAGRCDWNRESLAKSPASAALRKCCEQALAAEPAARFASAADFAASLEAAVRPVNLRWSPFIAAAAILLILLASIAGGGFFRSTPPPAAPPLHLEIVVWQEGIRKELSHAVPLLNGDELRVEATIPPKSAGLLLLLNSAGELQTLKDVPASSAATPLVFPDGQSAAPLTGNPGTEAILLLTAAKLPSLAELQADWQSGAATWPSLPEFAIVRVTDAGTKIEQNARDLGHAVRKSDPEGDVKGRLEAFRRRLAEKNVRLEGYAFAHGR